MSNIPVHTTYDTWTVAELVDATSPNPRGNKKVTIPEFQRRLVWTRKKREGLIESIKGGLPFGSLLVYKDTDTAGIVERYKLIDGLQRTQTIMQYSSHPNNTFNKSHIPDEFIDFVAKEINFYSDLNCLAPRNKEKIRHCILEWVWESRGFTETVGWGINALTDVLLLKMLELEEETFELFMARKELLDPESEYSHQLQQFLNTIQNISDIGGIEIPITIYSGPSKSLANVFVLLNQEGIKLKRYEIYAAEWLDCRYRITNTDIIDAIWKKYAELEKAGFNLDVIAEAPDAESRLEREYTLFEYLFGLGQQLSIKYPLFFKPVKNDQPSPFGFNLMSACVGGSVAEKDVRNLPENIRGLDFSRLEQCLLESVEFVYQLIKPLLSSQRIGQKKTPYFHADLQIVSQIATAFRVRYNTKDLTEIEGWEEKRNTLAKHLPMYYLRDVLQPNWHGSGDRRLADILENERYLDSPASKEEWNQILNLWFSDHVSSRQHANKFVKDDYPEYLLLRFILVHKLAKQESFHVQHIVPVLRLISPPSYYYENNGPINSVGNLALISDSEFTDIGDLTYVEFLNRKRSSGSIRGPGYYHDELKKWRKLLLCEADMLPSELTQEAFETFLRRRFELLKAEFLRVWREHIPPDPQT